MAGASSREVLRHLNTLFHCGTVGQLSDTELLEQFVAARDQAAEAAFAALVERHGAMVLGVCRRVLGNRDAAEDAFQATFLVLAKKAATIARREQLASWLHGVARRAALDARARAARQQAREKRLAAMLPVEPPDQAIASEVRAILDEELARLPERHRAAVVLCELEGLSRRDAAARLGVSEGTLSSRLARAKTTLRDRLSRRGFALSTAALASLLTRDAAAVIVPPVLVDSTIRVATLVAAGSSLAAVVSTSVATLTDGVMKAMLLAKLKYAFLGLVTLAAVSAGVGVVAQDGPDRVSDKDRLQSVERKLDKLLEVLGGSSRARPSANALSKPEVTSLRFNDAPDNQPPAVAATPPPAGPGAPPAPPNAPAALPSSADWRPTPVAPPPPGRADLAGRIDHLERRLGDLERRIGALEGRLKSAAPVIGTAVPTPPYIVNPDTARRARDPFDQENVSDGPRLRPGPSVDDARADAPPAPTAPSPSAPVTPPSPDAPPPVPLRGDTRPFTSPRGNPSNERPASNDALPSPR